MYLTRLLGALLSASLLPMSLSAQDVRWRVGEDGDAPEYLFGYVSEVLVLPDSSVVVLDRQLSEVKHFSSSGQFLGYFGATGQGPGELKRVTAVTVSDSTVMVSGDIGTRFNVFDHKRELVETGRFESAGGWIRLGEDRAILSELDFTEPGAPPWSSKNTVNLARLPGTQREALFLVETGGSGGWAGKPEYVISQQGWPQGDWELGGSDLLVLGDGIGAELVWYDVSHWPATIMARSRLEASPRLIRAAECRERFSPRPGSPRVSEVGCPEFTGVVRRVAVGTTGSVLLQWRPTPDQDWRWGCVVPGGSVTPVALPDGFRPDSFSPGWVAGYWVDEYDTFSVGVVETPTC